MKLTSDELAHLKLYEPDTYAICLGTVGKSLEAKGLVKWVPPVFGNAPNYAITEKGKSVCNEQKA